MAKAMTREELWAAYCKRNPQFANEGEQVTLSVAGLKKLFDQTFDMGETRGRSLAVASQPSSNSGRGRDFRDIFGF